MARSLLNAPLPVLLQQLDELHAALSLDEPAAALAAARIDPVELARELEDAIAAGWAASGALGLAHNNRDLLVQQRKAWREAFVAWVATVRTMLRRSPAREAVAEVRRRLGRYTGKSFASGRDQLELAVAALRTHADALEVRGWVEDPFAPAEVLLAGAVELAEAGARADRDLADRSRQAAEARRRAQALIRRVRLAWEVARTRRPTLPDLPLDALREYEPRPRPRPRTAHAPPAPAESELEAFSGESEAFSSRMAPFSCDLEPFSARERVESTREGFESTREGVQSTREGCESTQEGR